MTSWSDLGLNEQLVKTCEKLNWESPTPVQLEAIRVANEGRDIVALAETGSGKTGAFALPILNALIAAPQRYFALVLTPTRELSKQICEQFELLGESINVKSVALVGGEDIMGQKDNLAKKPHIIVATPGRVIDHFDNTKVLHLKKLKYLVFDEADCILNMDFEEDVDRILKIIPKNRQTFLFSATMTHKLSELRRTSLKNPVRINTCRKFQSVDALKAYYLYKPQGLKDFYLAYILKKWSDKTSIIFTSTRQNSSRLKYFLRYMGFSTGCLHGGLKQKKRVLTLSKFQSKTYTILLATDVASRGLDIPNVDLVINYDVPTHCTEYIHRVGRTARAGQEGTAITFVTPFDVKVYQNMEKPLGKKLPLYRIDEKDAISLKEAVEEAQNNAKENCDSFPFALTTILDVQQNDDNQESKQSEGEIGRTAV